MRKRLRKGKRGWGERKSAAAGVGFDDCEVGDVIEREVRNGRDLLGGFLTKSFRYLNMAIADHQSKFAGRFN